MIPQLNQPWAIGEPGMRSLIGRIKSKLSGEALPEGSGQSALTVNGTRVIPVVGPLFRYDNWMTEWGYGVSYDWLYRELDAAKNDPDVQEILFVIDSPGGEANGCYEISEYIRASDSVKPVFAHVSGTAASAAYWIASAARSISATRTSYAGSIGCIAVAYDDSEWLKNIGLNEIVFVSSVSPNKYADLTKEEGRSLIQKHVDELGKIFVDSVALHRSTDSESVASKFGAGDVLIATDALSAGMIDSIQNMEDAIRVIYESRETRGLPMDKTILGLGKNAIQAAEPSEDPDKEEDPAAPEEDAKDDVVPPADPESSEDEESEKAAAAFMKRKPRAAAYLIRIGADSERKRQQEIDHVAAAFPYNKQLIQRAKYEENMTASDFILEAAKSGQRAASTAIRNLDADAAEIPEVNAATSALPGEALERAAVEHAASLNRRKK